MGVVPFFLYAGLFLIAPAAQVLIGAFRDIDGGWTLDNVRTIFDDPYIGDFRTSIEISVVTALVGGLLGFLIAYAAIREGTPRWIRTVLTTFSGVAANFAGIPLAFGFIATLGTIGVVTKFMRGQGFDPYK